MESAKELRARIVKLDIEIEQQKKLLTNLERDKKLAQRQLNAVLDPVARLPFEISSNILLLSRTAFPEPGAMHIPMLLLNICDAWSNIALSTPALWSAIGITFPCARGLKKLLPIWLERARHHPLSVLLSEGEFDPEVIPVLWSYGQQLKHLEIYEIDGDRYIYGDPRALWGRTKLGPLPLLETLTFHGFEDGGGYAFSLCRVVQLLHLAPNLAECLFSHARIWLDLGASETLVLPNLRRMLFGEPGTCPGFGNHVLDYLSLPGLESLSTLWSFTESGEDLLSFLTRSSPPLLDLSLETSSKFNSPAECLCLTPDLRRFEVWTQSDVMEEFFGALVRSPSLLPRLDTLIIHFNFFPRNSFWMALLPALFSRPSQFRVFRIEIPSMLPASQMPAPKVIAAL